MLRCVFPSCAGMTHGGMKLSQRLASTYHLAHERELQTEVVMNSRRKSRREKKILEGANVYSQLAIKLDQLRCKKDEVCR